MPREWNRAQLCNAIQPQSNGQAKSKNKTFVKTLQNWLGKTNGAWAEELLTRYVGVLDVREGCYRRDPFLSSLWTQTCGTGRGKGEDYKDDIPPKPKTEKCFTRSCTS